MDPDSGYQTLLNLHSGIFNELFLTIPPTPVPIHIADLWIGAVADLTNIHSDIDEHSSAIAANTTAGQGTAAGVTTNDSNIELKHDILTARWPLRNLSLGFSPGSDAEQDEADWYAHLDRITAHESTVAAQQVLLDQLVTLLPPPPAGNDYMF